MVFRDPAYIYVDAVKLLEQVSYLLQNKCCSSNVQNVPYCMMLFFLIVKSLPLFSSVELVLLLEADFKFLHEAPSLLTTVPDTRVPKVVDE